MFVFNILVCSENRISNLHFNIAVLYSKICIIGTLSFVRYCYAVLYISNVFPFLIKSYNSMSSSYNDNTNSAKNWVELKNANFGKSRMGSRKT